MTAAEILSLVGQALAILPTLIQTGINVTQRIEALIGLTQASAAGTVTQDQIDAVRNQLDADLAEFNADLPPDGE